MNLPTDQHGAIREYLSSLIDCTPVRALLDIGCGEGVDLRALSEHLSPDARLVGIDPSPAAVETAKLATRDDPRFLFNTADLAEGLPFREHTFDAVLAVNVLESLRDKHALLREIHRILVPGGQLLCANFDWDLQAFVGEDPVLVRKLLQGYQEWQQCWREGSDPWMGRRLWHMMQQSALFTGRIETYVLVDTEYLPTRFGYDQVHAMEQLITHGHIRAEDFERFDGELEQLSARNAYLYAIPLFIYVGKRKD
jgi:ubiquinone/menaquinone biosynthesis C-methylase UbiE